MTSKQIRKLESEFILSMKMAIPTKVESEDIKKQTNRLESLINNIYNRNIKLREARDILMPKLMSGEIEV